MSETGRGTAEVEGHGSLPQEISSFVTGFVKSNIKVLALCPGDTSQASAVLIFIRLEGRNSKNMPLSLDSES